MEIQKFDEDAFFGYAGVESKNPFIGYGVILFENDYYDTDFILDNNYIYLCCIDLDLDYIIKLPSNIIAKALIKALPSYLTIEQIEKLGFKRTN